MGMLKPPIEPMEAVLAKRIPEEEGWQYEPKWDGFRCLLFRSGDEVFLQSKTGQPLARYFPEIVSAAKTLKPRTWALDGELAIPLGPSFSFDQLLLRIHPAASRVAKLAREIPAIYIAFDLLMTEKGEVLLESPLSERRTKLEYFARHFRHDETFLLSPMTLEIQVVRDWLKKTSNNLDGIVCKRRESKYESGVSTGFRKVKNYRSIDCVVGGFRYGKGNVVGSLLLGVYDEAGKLNHVGFTSGIQANERAALTRKLEKLISPPGFDGDAPGGQSRWKSGSPRDWKPLRAELVVEVCYDHFTGGRFRHGTRLLRWRPDKAPRQCGYQQLPKPSSELRRLLKKSQKH
jgi:ATP-dependent DNA ligase